MLDKGIEAKSISCPLMGVAASRNFAAKQASGELLWAIDNDATFAFTTALPQLVKLFSKSTIV